MAKLVLVFKSSQFFESSRRVFGDRCNGSKACFMNVSFLSRFVAAMGGSEFELGLGN